MVAQPTLQQWFVAILHGAGVDASLVLSQAAVVSTLVACGLSDNLIMTSADWALACTMHVNYMPLLPTCRVRIRTVSSRNAFASLA